MFNPAWLAAFVRRVNQAMLPVEGIVIYTDDEKRAEYRWTDDLPRNIYSHTKSYMVTAAGLAIDEGLLHLNDRAADFFPEALPENPDPRLYDITLETLLTMSSGFGEALLMMDVRRFLPHDYAKFVFSHPLKHDPGARFCYSNGDSYLAGRMVEKAVGKPLYDYLNERLFRPMGMADPEWEHTPLGYTFGASGLRLRLNDMARLGRLYLNHGLWQGRRLIPESWVETATKRHIAIPNEGANRWTAGYGYQFWMCDFPGAYRADGAFGQISCVLPAANAVVGIQCTESEGRSGDVLTALEEEILLKM